jgi:hypothetical protein
MLADIKEKNTSAVLIKIMLIVAKKKKKKKKKNLTSLGIYKKNL